MYDHGFMDVIPIIRQSKIDFIHKQVACFMEAVMKQGTYQLKLRIFVILC